MIADRYRQGVVQRAAQTPRLDRSSLAALRVTLLAATVMTSAGCKEEAPQIVYRAVPVEQRDIVVSAQAAGAVQPDTTVEVKSKASGEVLRLNAETGQLVKRGALLVHIDPRNARNALAQAQADLSVAQAKLTNATSQKRRADELFQTQSITEQEHEQALLDFADASAQVVRSRVAVDNARIQLEDTDVRAPITGTIIEKTVERGTVIASATSNVSGGTTLLKMADLNLVQVRALVDETDVGKVQPGQLTTITVDAFPNRTFDGTVLKIEPQAIVEQNVTMFAVLIKLQNRGGLLKPGMNAEVQIKIANRDSVNAVPTAALRADTDVALSAVMLGMDESTLRAQIWPQPKGGEVAAGAAAGGKNVLNLNGRTITLPDGVDAKAVTALMEKRRGGQELSTDERELMRRVFQAGG
ncbi:MAG TPA: efflux RND transporter periplasmic adaptor subunit, partial [Gemmatimonadales bacterium]|nr:efflux RND transporter periplasmic adaptor subunit [Gemmatimonadales bacterium]